MSDPPVIAAFASPEPVISASVPSTVEARDHRSELELELAGMRRELAGVEHRLEQLQDPGERRPLDRLGYEQARYELEDYRDTVRAQIREQEKRVRAARRGATT